jgi:hypothetical protein
VIDDLALLLLLALWFAAAIGLMGLCQRLVAQPPADRADTP